MVHVGGLAVRLVNATFSRLRDFWCNLSCSSLAEAGPETRFLHPARVLVSHRERKRIRVGSRSIIRGELFCFPQGGAILIGDDCFIGADSRLWSAASIEIGNRVLISHGVEIHDSSGHPMDAAARAEHFTAIRTTGFPSTTDFEALPIKIGDDAWIGFRSVVRQGVHIGKGAIVGAMSVVTTDVPDYAVVVGNPARIVRVQEAEAR